MDEGIDKQLSHDIYSLHHHQHDLYIKPKDIHYNFLKKFLGFCYNILLIAVVHFPVKLLNIILVIFI